MGSLDLALKEWFIASACPRLFSRLLTLKLTSSLKGQKKIVGRGKFNAQTHQKRALHR
ncbi:MAG: hypothetical protein ACI92E_000997 [Oceanicoccus sp.]|jgi:hypothetical protein